MCEKGQVFLSTKENKKKNIHFHSKWKAGTQNHQQPKDTADARLIAVQSSQIHQFADFMRNETPNYLKKISNI